MNWKEFKESNVLHLDYLNLIEQEYSKNVRNCIVLREIKVNSYNYLICLSLDDLARFISKDFLQDDLKYINYHMVSKSNRKYAIIISPIV